MLPVEGCTALPVSRCPLFSSRTLVTGGLPGVSVGGPGFYVLRLKMSFTLFAEPFYFITIKLPMRI